MNAVYGDVKVLCRPFENYSGPMETILAGPYHNLIQSEALCHFSSALQL